MSVNTFTQADDFQSLCLMVRMPEKSSRTRGSDRVLSQQCLETECSLLLPMDVGFLLGGVGSVENGS